MVEPSSYMFYERAACREERKVNSEKNTKRNANPRQWIGVSFGGATFSMVEYCPLGGRLSREVWISFGGILLMQSGRLPMFLQILFLQTLAFVYIQAYNENTNKYRGARKAG